MHGLIYDFLIFALAAIIFVPLFRWLKLGAILAYLTAGILIGPQIIGLIKDPGTILHFSELGVIFLLFIIGLELAPEKLWELRKSIFGLGLLQVLVTGLVFWGIGLSFGISNSTAFVGGFGLALSSTAFCIQILEERRQLPTPFGQGTFSVLMFQDLAVVPLMLALGFFSEGGNRAVQPLLILKMLGVLAILILMGRYLIRYLLRWIAQSHAQEVFTALSLLIVLGTAVVVENIGLSMGMGAFMAGVLLANSEYRHELEINLQPFKGLLLGLFFMAVGMSLDLYTLFEQPLVILLVTLGFMTVKIIIIYGLSRWFKFSKHSSKQMAFLLPQGGEFAFVLFNTALVQNLIDSSTASILNASVTISMGLTPLLYFLNNRYLDQQSKKDLPNYDEIQQSGTEVIIAGFGRFGQIVARFLRTQNIPMTILDHSAEQIETARKFKNTVFYGDASRSDLLEAAGAKNAKFLILAIDDMDSSVATAATCRKHFPNLKIIARARNRRHSLQLMELGIPAEDIHRETFLTSLEVAKEVLLSKGRDRETINKKLALFVQHDERILKQQFEFRADDAQFVSYTVQATKDLEDILRADEANQAT